VEAAHSVVWNVFWEGWTLQLPTWPVWLSETPLPVRKVAFRLMVSHSARWSSRAAITVRPHSTTIKRIAATRRIYGFIAERITVAELRVLLADPAVRSVGIADVTFDLNPI